MRIGKPGKLWKSLKLSDDGRIVSDHDESEWTVGEWRTVCAPTEECVGLNACENIVDAIGYVTPDVIAEVEVVGCCIKGDDKYTCERMRVIRAWKWDKEDSVALAIFAARLCLKNFEDVYPNDHRPRLAIEAAEAYQLNPSKAARSAARSAAWSAESAASAARSAASAARSAAWSAARSAASAAWSAASAAWSAESAESAAKTQKNKMHVFLVEHFRQKTPIGVAE